MIFFFVVALGVASGPGADDAETAGETGAVETGVVVVVAVAGGGGTGGATALEAWVVEEFEGKNCRTMSTTTANAMTALRT